jgi:hypothetical protein
MLFSQTTRRVECRARRSARLPESPLDAIRRRLPWRHIASSAATVAVLLLAACGEDPQSSTPTGPSSSQNDTSNMRWELTDGCRDGRGIQLKFLDRANNRVWPGSSEVYLIPSGETRAGVLSCRTGANICYGARRDPETSTYWGVDLDGSRSCDGCCNTCRDTTVTRTLTCD